MKKLLIRTLAIAAFSISFVAGYAQFVTLSQIVGNSDPGTMAYYVNSLANALQTAQNTVSEVENTTAMLQAQYDALKSLSTGSWDGFVTAFDDETKALQDYSTVIAQLPTLGGPDGFEAINKLVQTAGYQDMAQSSANIATSMTAADRAVDATNTLYKNTIVRGQLWPQLLAQSKSTDSVTSQLQSLNSAMSLLGGELADLHTTLNAVANYYVTRDQIQQEKAIEDNAAWNKFCAQSFDPDTATATTAVHSTWDCGGVISQN